MSWTDPTTIEGMRALVYPQESASGERIAIRLEGDSYTMELDDARGFCARLSFAIEVAQRQSIERQMGAIRRAA